VPSESSQAVFYHLFRYVTTATRLSLEASDDAGSTWTELWSRNGNGSTSSSGWDLAFNPSSVSLAAYAGRPVRLRFVFETQNSSFIGPEVTRGVFLDDISVSNATELVETATTALSSNATSFTLNATTAGAPLAPGKTYILRLRPNVGTRWFGDGELKSVTAEDIDPTHVTPPPPAPAPIPRPDPETESDEESEPDFPEDTPQAAPPASPSQDASHAKSQASKKHTKSSASASKKSKALKKSLGSSAKKSGTKKSKNKK
jgi:outer membrane biosynthesis protein TonB